MKVIFILSSLFLFSACAIIQEPYYYNEIVMRNNTNEVLRKVKIQSMKTNRMFRCANISPGAYCSNKFPKRKYQHDKLGLYWQYQQKEKIIDDVVLDIPENMSRETPLRGVLVVNVDGTIKVFVESEQSLRIE